MKTSTHFIRSVTVKGRSAMSHARHLPNSRLDVTEGSMGYDKHLISHTVTALLHSHNHAARFGSFLIAAKHGRVARGATPSETVAAEPVGETLGLRCLVVSTPVVDTPHVVPLGRELGQA